MTKTSEQLWSPPISDRSKPDSGSDSPLAVCVISATRHSQHRFTPPPPPPFSPSLNLRSSLPGTHRCRSLKRTGCSCKDALRGARSPSDVTTTALQKPRVSLSPFPCASILTMSGAACESSECVSEPAVCATARVCVSVSVSVCVSAWVCACEGGVRKTIVSFHWLKHSGV